MSNVPKSHRKEHDFVAVHNLIKLRRDITELAIYDFGYDKDKYEKSIKNFEDRLKLDDDKKAQVIAKMRKKNESYFADFVEEETTVTRDLMRKAVFEFEMGNSLFPSGDAVLMEFCEKRKHLNNAIGYLYCLKQELQYIAETLPSDKNRYITIIEDIAREVSLIKGVRRSANKFLKKKK